MQTLSINMAQPTLASHYLNIKPGFDDADIAARFIWNSQEHCDWYTLAMGNNYLAWLNINWQGLPHLPGVPEIFDLYVQENQRRQGYVRLLVEHAEELARQRGYPQIGLSVNPTENPQAQKLYTALHYYPHGSL